MATARRFSRWVLLIAIAASVSNPGASGQQAVDRAAPGRPIRVLFIGNSYTYVNNLPELLETLSRSSTAAVVIQAEMVAVAGATLRQHWEAGQAARRIRERTWDYVVLQEQSGLGISLVNGELGVNDPRFFHTYARVFNREIRDAGAKTVFMLTWSNKSQPAHQTKLSAAYQQIASELGATLVAVGPAWLTLRNSRPDLELYMPDGAHPSPVGSYLAACMFYQALVGASPAGLPGQLEGHAIAVANVRAEQLTRIVSLPAADARAVQDVAVAASKEFSVERLSMLAPPAEPPPALPAGRKLTPLDLVGVWTGTSKLYRTPAAIELRVAREADRWMARWQVTSSTGAQQMVVPVTTFTVTDTLLVFSVQNFNGGVERYRGVYTGESLVGTAEFGGVFDPPHLVGSWELKRIGSIRQTTSLLIWPQAWPAGIE